MAMLARPTSCVPKVAAYDRWARVAGFRPSGGITDRRTHYIDPTVDLSGLPLDIEVTSIRIKSVTLRWAVARDVTIPGSHLR